jgi:hypothetical protein
VTIRTRYFACITDDGKLAIEVPDPGDGSGYIIVDLGADRLTGWTDRFITVIEADETTQQACDSRLTALVWDDCVPRKRPAPTP